MNIGVNSGRGETDLNAVLKLTQTFGTTRTLSSPRLSAINNQQAILTFARNEVVQDCKTSPGTSTPGTGGAQPTVTSPTTNCTASSLPIGIVLNILPTIDLDSQEVTLSVRPTLTRIVGQTRDGSIDSSGKQSNNFFPIIEVREMDSIAKVKTGGVMILGGLMEDTSRNSSDGAPGLAELPIFGNLFKNRSEDSTKRELAIFIKAKIVNSDGNTDKIDRAVMKKYTTDPRPAFPDEQ
jgi:general secretion pathway protein D